MPATTIGERVRRQHDADHRRPHVPHREHACEPHEDQGPKQVELLLDRQRPEVQQRRGLRVSGEIVGGDDGVAVVRDVQRSRTAIAGDFRESHRRQHHCRRNQGDDDHDQCSRQQSPGSPSVERRKVDATRGLLLPQEQPGDQEAGDDEEDIHADEAAAESRQTRMKSQHGQDRDRPQALDVRPKVRCRFRRDGGIPRRFLAGWGDDRRRGRQRHQPIPKRRWGGRSATPSRPTRSTTRWRSSSLAARPSSSGQRFATMTVSASTSASSSAPQSSAARCGRCSLMKAWLAPRIRSGSTSGS